MYPVHRCGDNHLQDAWEVSTFEDGEAVDQKDLRIACRSDEHSIRDASVLFGVDTMFFNAGDMRIGLVDYAASSQAREGIFQWSGVEGGEDITGGVVHHHGHRAGEVKV